MKTIVLTFLFINQAMAIKPFIPDGCTSWKEGTRKDKFRWLHCCYKHDKLYFIGGTKKEKKSADKRIKRCIKATDSNFHAALVYFGLRVGGRWGWGSYWERTKQQKKDKEKKYKRYRLLTEYEKNEVEYEINTVDCAKFVIAFTGNDTLVSKVCFGVL